MATDNIAATDHLVEELFGLWRWMRHVSHSIREGEATSQQFWLLHQLRNRGTLTVGEVAEVLGVSQSSATIAFKRLKSAELVRRTRSRSDERTVEITLTEDGLRKVESWRQRRRQAVANLLEPLTPDEREDLQRLAERVLCLTNSQPTSHSR